MAEAVLARRQRRESAGATSAAVAAGPAQTPGRRRVSRPPQSILPSAAAVAAGLPEQRRRRSARIEERRRQTEAQPVQVPLPQPPPSIARQEEELADELFGQIFPADAIRAAVLERTQLSTAIRAMEYDDAVVAQVNTVAERHRGYLNGFTSQTARERLENIRGMRVLLRRQENQLSRRLFHAYASPYLFGKPLDDFHDTIVDMHNQLSARQKALFGKDEALSAELTSVVLDIHALLSKWDLFFAGETQLPPTVLVTDTIHNQLRALLTEALRLMPRTNAALQQARALIRRTCSNREDVFSGEPVQDIPDDAFFQTLSNRQCYDMNGLVEYIETVSNGRNEQPYSAEEVAANSVALRNGQPLLPHRPIWHVRTNVEDDEEEAETELESLLNHRVAEHADLRDFIESRSAAALAEQISDAQLYRLGQLAAIMRSRGDTFLEAARPYFTAEEMQRWLAVRGEQERVELPPPIRRAVPSNAPGASVDSRLKYKINELIKPPAVLEFLHYLEAQPAEFREALALLSPTLERDLRSCLANQMCVMLMGNDVAKAHNAIAAVKPNYVPPP